MTCIRLIVLRFPVSLLGWRWLAAHLGGSFEKSIKVLFIKAKYYLQGVDGQMGIFANSFIERYFTTVRIFLCTTLAIIWWAPSSVFDAIE